MQRKRLKILTFNHHESFLSAMSELGHEFDVVVRRKNLDLGWLKSAREPPINFKLIDFEVAKRQLKSRGYDIVICHTVKNLVWIFWFFDTRAIFVAHIPLFWDGLGQKVKSAAKWLMLFLYRFTHQCHFVAVSDWKMQTWYQNKLTSAPVKFFPIPFPPAMIATRKSTSVLPVVVGNGLKSRGLELGWNLLEPLVQKFSIRIIGRNPDIPTSITPNDYPEFVRLFSESHIYVYTIQRPIGDGYNTAMLEAMNLGMPVITMVNPSSPIKHEYNGLVANDLVDLEKALRRLIDDRELREQLGAKAKETIDKEFTKQKFLYSWKMAINSAIESGHTQNDRSSKNR